MNERDNMHHKFIIKPDMDNHVKLFTDIHMASDLKKNGTYDISIDFLSLLHLRKTRAAGDGSPNYEKQLILFNWTFQHEENILLNSIFKRGEVIENIYNSYYNETIYK